MRIDSYFEISRGEWIAFPKAVQDHIKTACTYTNPKFAEAARLGFSTHSIPKAILTYAFDETDGRILIDRGEIRKVINAIASIPMATEFQLDDTTIDNPIEIEYKNEDFELDERQERCLDACLNNNQGIIHAATSAGKSAVIMALIGARKQKTLIIVNRKGLIDQLKRDAEKWLGKGHIGMITDGKCRVGNVTFALEKSLLKHIDQVKNEFGMVIMDECHVSAANSFQRLFHTIPARFRYGLTGTVKRKDQMHFLMYASFGPILETITKDELEEAGRTTPVKVQIHETNTTVNPEVFSMDPVKKQREIEKAINEDEGRMSDVCMLVDKLLSDESASIQPKIVVTSRFLKPLERIGEILASNYPQIRVRYVTGKEKDQDANCQALEAGECDVILATIQCFATGINIPSLTDVVLISPVFSNELMLHQLRGRLMRKSEGKSIGTVHFMFDSNIYDQRKLNQFLSIMKR